MVWLHSNKWSKLWFFDHFPCTACYITNHIPGKEYFYEMKLHHLVSYSMLFHMIYDMRVFDSGRVKGR